MCKAKVLIVEDDPAISNLIRTTMESQMYQHRAVWDGAGALTEFTSFIPDVIILDLGLPDMDGVDVIRKVRDSSNVPIIVVSARTEDREKVEALDAGADDYLTKPFCIEEFLARLRATLRRSITGTQFGEETNLYENGDLKIDFAAGCAYVKEEEIHLTPIEYKLLCLLAQNTGKVLTHNFILREVWGAVQPSDVSSMRVFMTTLRKKIEKDASSPQYIQTHIGIGYRLMRK